MKLDGTPFTPEEIAQERRVRAEFPDQTRMADWLANKNIPEGFDAMITTEGALTFIHV